MILRLIFGYYSEGLHHERVLGIIGKRTNLHLVGIMYDVIFIIDGYIDV